jgi:hypothetical protein
LRLRGSKADMKLTRAAQTVKAISIRFTANKHTLI